LNSPHGHPPGGGAAGDPASSDLEARLRGSRSGWIRWIFLAGLTALVFWFVFQRLDMAAVQDTFRRADLRWVALAGLITVTFPAFSALRWGRMLAALGHPIRFSEAFEMIMAAWPMGTITPSKAGDVVKAYYLKDRVPVRVVLGSVLAERAVDVLVLLALALFGCLAFGRTELALLSGAGLFAGIAGIFVALKVRLPLPPKIAEKIEGVLLSLRTLGQSPSLLGSVVLLTILNWMASVVQVVFCYKAFGVDISLLFATGALPLAIFVGLLPVTLSGMGTRDSALIALFAAFAEPEVSLGVGLLYTLFGYGVPGIAGLPFMRRVLGRMRS